MIGLSYRSMRNSTIKERFGAELRSPAITIASQSGACSRGGNATCCCSEWTSDQTQSFIRLAPLPDFELISFQISHGAQRSVRQMPRASQMVMPVDVVTCSPPG